MGVGGLWVEFCVGHGDWERDPVAIWIGEVCFSQAMTACGLHLHMYFVTDKSHRQEGRISQTDIVSAEVA